MTSGSRGGGATTGCSCCFPFVMVGTDSSTISWSSLCRCNTVSGVGRQKINVCLIGLEPWNDYQYCLFHALLRFRAIIWFRLLSLIRPICRKDLKFHRP